MIKVTRIDRCETYLDPIDLSQAASDTVPVDELISCELQFVMEQSKEHARGVTAKGIVCLQLSAEGLSSTEKCEAALAVLQNHAPQAYPEVKATTERILGGTDPMFCKLDIDKPMILDFWVWFREQEHYLAEHTEEGARLISERINDLFPFGDQELKAAITSEESGLVVLFHDSFSVALKYGYEELLSELPDDLEGNWVFRVVNYI